MHIALRLTTLALGGLNIYPKLLPGVAPHVIVAVHIPGGSHTLQGLTDDIAAVLNRGHKRGEPASVMAMRETVELAVLIVCRDIGNAFRMQHFNVIGLVKVIRDDFPITAGLGGHIQHPKHVLDPM